MCVCGVSNLCLSRGLLAILAVSDSWVEIPSNCCLRRRPGVIVCVCVRERERESEREKKRERACVSVCLRESVIELIPYLPPCVPFFDCFILSLPLAIS